MPIDIYVSILWYICIKNINFRYCRVVKILIATSRCKDDNLCISILILILIPADAKMTKQKVTQKSILSEAEEDLP